MKTVRSGWNNYRWWMIGSILLATLMLVFGFLCVDGFGPNIYSEALGLLVSIPVAVVVVEAILDRRDNEKWADVRDQTGRTIETISQQIAFDMQLFLAADRRQQIPSPAVLPVGGHAAMLRRLAGALRERVGESDPNPDVLRLHTELGQPLMHLTDGLGARIHSSGDPEFVSRYGMLLEAMFAWDRARYVHEDDHVEVLWDNAADLADALADLVEYAHTWRAAAEA